MDFKALVAQLSVLYSKLTLAQKVIVAGAVTGIVGFLIFLVVYTSSGVSKQEYRPLFENLSSADAAKVIEHLEKEKVPYRIPRDNVIEVPQEYLYRERIAIASQGIAQDVGVGFELFNQQDFGATRFDQDVKFLRALEGELARTIDALAPVERSNVNLALPKESLFVSKEVPPTASVMIKLRPERKLSPKQIRGIKNLVAASVSKLEADNVTLVNDEGESLGESEGVDELGELSAIQQRFKHKEEQKKEQKIVSVLSPFIGGDDRVRATVTIEYDFSQESYTSETFDPENIVRSEQNSEEKREGMAPSEVGGVPGVVSNIGPVQGLASQKNGEKYEKSSTTTNYEISKTVATSKGEFAKIKRISAAVVVDGKYKIKIGEDGEPTSEREYVALDESQLEAITSLVRQSIGIDETRGDRVSVHNFPFEATQQQFEGENGATKLQAMMDAYVVPFSGLLQYLFAFAVLFIAYKKVIAPFAERMLEISKEDEELEKPVLHLEDDGHEDLVEKAQQMRKRVEDQLGMGENFSEDDLKHDVLLEKMRNIAEERPDEIASLLQALLNEEGTLNEPKSFKD
ncbi:MAG: flagellar M-ring protein FliF [Campylobacterales bacterium]|nr:flagellar M-ring protein FliF [Campylobacterales bacterium]